MKKSQTKSPNKSLTKSILLFAVLFSLQTLTHTSTVNAQNLPKFAKDAPLPANLFIELSKLINPAVVNINTTQLPKQRQMMGQGFGGRGGSRGDIGRDPFFDLFAPFMGPMQEQPRQSLGTGFFIRKDGLIITNNHVVDGADIIKVQVMTSPGTEELFEAVVIGKDARTDIALLKISGKKDFPEVKFGESSALEVGEWVAAFGNPFGHGHSVTKGIVSAIGREIGELNRFPFIQTDASINPGNSGGPLVNTRGEVIGVNTAIDARAQGIGFAIPIDNVKATIKTLEKDGFIKRAFLGIALADIQDPRVAQYLNLRTNKGALVEQIFENTPAAKAGLKPYDFIVKYGNKDVESAGDLTRFISDSGVGDKVEVEYFREGKLKKLTVSLEQHPEDKARSAPENVKQYFGQKAPYDLGFKVADINRDLKEEFGLSEVEPGKPVIVEVEPNSAAAKGGLESGDVILDLNKAPVKSSKDLLKGLQKKFNVLRVQRGNRALLVYI